MTTETTEPTDEAEVEQAEVEPTDEAEETEQQDTFDRLYVEKLRDESAKYRQRAGRADDLAAALWSERVAATGRLADPTDLDMPDDADPLDGEAVAAAVEALLSHKPHLASRKPRGDVGQGVTGSLTSVDLAGMLRSRV